MALGEAKPRDSTGRGGSYVPARADGRQEYAHLEPQVAVAQPLDLLEAFLELGQRPRGVPPLDLAKADGDLDEPLEEPDKKLDTGPGPTWSPRRAGDRGTAEPGSNKQGQSNVSGDATSGGW
jgi:hypothetical protein